MEAVKILAPQDTVDILPAIKVLSPLNGSKEYNEALKDGVIQDLRGGKKYQTGSDRSKYLNLELSAYDRLNHTQRLSNQAAAHAAVQRQPKWIILWRPEETRD